MDTILTDEQEQFGIRNILRLVTWGATAVVMSALAVIAARTEVGAQRASTLLQAMTTEQPSGSGGDALMQATAARLAEAERESRRLSDTVRALAADRDRLVARLDAIEKQPPEVTGSIPRPVAESKPPPEPKTAARPAPIIPGVGTSLFTASTQIAAAPLPAPRPAVPPRGPATPAIEYGVDLGTEITMPKLRERWETLLASHGRLLGNLRPLVALRESPRSGALEMHLIVGPFANIGAAGRLCETLSEAGIACLPSSYDGQRLAAR